MGIFSQASRSNQGSQTRSFIYKNFQRFRLFLINNLAGCRAAICGSLRKKEAVCEFIIWFLPSFLFCLFIYFFRDYIDFNYFAKAADEGIGGRLWNVIGGLGMILFGLVLFLPSIRALKIAAHGVLKSSFGIGAMSLGLLLAKSTFDIGVNTFTQKWQAWFFGISMTLLIPCVIALTFAVYFTGHLVYQKDNETPFMQWYRSTEITFRILAGSSVFAASFYALFIRHYS